MSSKQQSKATLAQRLSGIRQIIHAEFQASQKKVLAAMESSDYTALRHAVQILEQTMRMRELIDELLTLARHKKEGTPTPAPEEAASRYPEVSPDVASLYPAEHRTTSEYTDRGIPTTVVPKKITPARSSTTSKGSKRVIKRERGVRTSEREFIIPILQTLHEKGGQAPINEVINGVLHRMNNILKPSDYETTSGAAGSPRWKTTLYFVRTIMVRDGLLSNDSPRGVWSVTPQGLQYLAEHTPQAEKYDPSMDS